MQRNGIITIKHNLSAIRNIPAPTYFSEKALNQLIPYIETAQGLGHPLSQGTKLEVLSLSKWHGDPLPFLARATLLKAFLGLTEITKSFEGLPGRPSLSHLHSQWQRRAY